MAVPDIAANKHLEGSGFKAKVQKFGAYLAGMIMPNIAAFIAWGLITALFIPTGWLPNSELALLVGPMILFLLPLLIGYTGGRLVHGQRGAVVGAIATMGVIVGTMDPLPVGATIEGESIIPGGGTPMFLGAMIVGPLAAFLIKLVDNAIEDRIPTGFEMLINNFTAGIIGGAMALVGFLGIGPIVQWLTERAGDGVEFLVDNTLLPLASLIVEPAKILFLNNAINQGILTPLGAAEAAEAGKSILFMIETNPGPGLGILTAYLLFGPRVLRPTVPGAMIIHFLGGIHEIYFPYVLMKPRLVLAVIAGGASGVLTAQLTGAGLVSVPSPGSIFAYLAVTPRGGFIPVLSAIVIAFAVSFAVASLLLGFGRGEKKDQVMQNPEDAVPQTFESSSDSTAAAASDSNLVSAGATQDPPPTTTGGAHAPVANQKE